MNVFAAFIDFQKAFDWVNREFLLYKLASKFKVDGNMYFAIKSLLIQNHVSELMSLLLTTLI